MTKHELNEDQVLSLNFKMSRLNCDYYSMMKLTEGVIHHQNMIEIAQKVKSVALACECCDMLLSYSTKMPELIDSNIIVLSSMLEEYTKNHEEKELKYCDMHLGLIKLFQACKSKDVNKTKELYEELSKIMKHHNMQNYAFLNFEIIITLLIFSLDPEQVDQGRVLQMKKEFIKMVNFADDKEEAYKVCYTMIGIFGLMVQFQQAMGATIDYKLILKYDKLLEDEKLSYISFYSSLETVQDVSILPYLDKALKFCDELQIPQFQKFRVNLNVCTIMTQLYSGDPDTINLALGKLKKLVTEYSKIDNEFIQQKLMVL